MPITSNVTKIATTKGGLTFERVQVRLKVGDAESIEAVEVKTIGFESSCTAEDLYEIARVANQMADDLAGTGNGSAMPPSTMFTHERTLGEEVVRVRLVPDADAVKDAYGEAPAPGELGRA